MFRCQECGKRFKSTAAAERAANVGCPKCGGVDVDLDPDSPIMVSRRLETARRMSGRVEEPSWDSLHREGL